MSDTQVMLSAAAAGAFALAVFAGWQDRRRSRRTRLDRIGLIDWPTVQVGAIIALCVLVSLALHR